MLFLHSCKINRINRHQLRKHVAIQYIWVHLFHTNSDIFQDRINVIAAYAIHI